MVKISCILIALLVSLTGCGSTCPPVAVNAKPVPPAKVETEETGFFQTEWMKALDDFRKELGVSSSDATN